MSASGHTDKLNALLRRLRNRFGSQAVKASAEPRALAADGQPDPLVELVDAFLVWECGRQKADLAMKRLTTAVVDVNELRVCFPDEIVAILGARYPRVEERAMRLRATLNDIYIREHAVTLNKLRAANKRDAWKYLSTLDGIPQFVAARVLLMALGGHALPVDDRLLVRLIGEGVVDPDTTIDQAAGFLERAIKAGESIEAHHLMLRWSEETAAPTRIPVAEKRPAGGARRASKPAGAKHAPKKAASKRR